MAEVACGWCGKRIPSTADDTIIECGWSEPMYFCEGCYSPSRSEILATAATTNDVEVARLDLHAIEDQLDAPDVEHLLAGTRVRLVRMDWSGAGLVTEDWTCVDGEPIPLVVLIDDVDVEVSFYPSLGRDVVVPL